MSGYKTHTTAALLFCGLLYLFPFWNELPREGMLTCVALCVFFGLFPDVDTKSKGQYIFLLLFVIVDLILIIREEYKKAAYMGLLVVLPVMSRHRGWTHSTVAMILIPLALYLALLQYSGNTPYEMLPYFLASFFGYASHLIVDKYL
jgi:membrane-bound metal-dependent hydrolase YbcI (DUF457 family)